VQDPAAGTGGVHCCHRPLHQKQKRTISTSSPKGVTADFQRKHAYVGIELVPDTHRLLPHEPHAPRHREHGGKAETRLPRTVSGSARLISFSRTHPSDRRKVEGGRRDPISRFTADTSNKQLAFVEHIVRALKPGSRAAVVVPDNVLFEDGVGRRFANLDDGTLRCFTRFLRLPNWHFLRAGSEDKCPVPHERERNDQGQHEGCLGLRHAGQYETCSARTKPLTVCGFRAI